MDPASARHILTFDDMRDHAEAERARADAEEARVRHLEEEIQRLRSQG